MRTRIIIILLMFILTTNIYSAKRTKIAVLDFAIGEGISSKLALQLSDYLRTILCTDRFLLVTRENMVEIFKERNFQEAECSETECYAKAGQILGVEKIIVGTVGKVGTMYLVTIKMLDINTGKYDFSDSVKTEGEEQKLIHMIDKLSNKICEIKEEEMGREDLLAGKGMLFIKTEPEGADIYIDGRKQQEKTSITLKDIESGRRRIRLELKGFVPIEEEVIIEPNKIKRIEKHFSVKNPDITVITEPIDAEIIINGISKGRTPITITDVSPGQIKLIIKKQEYFDIEEEMVLKENEPLTIERKLSKKIKRKIITTPPEAEILINEEIIGKTPIEKELKEGEYVLEIKKENYKPQKVKLEVQEQGEKEIFFKLDWTEEYTKKKEKLNKARIITAISFLVASAGFIRISYYFYNEAQKHYKNADNLYAKYKKSTNWQEISSLKKGIRASLGEGDKNISYTNISIGISGGFCGVSIVLFVIRF